MRLVSHRRTKLPIGFTGNLDCVDVRLCIAILRKCVGNLKLFHIIQLSPEVEVTSGRYLPSEAAR